MIYFCTCNNNCWIPLFRSWNAPQSCSQIKILEEEEEEEYERTTQSLYLIHCDFLGLHVAVLGLFLLHVPPVCYLHPSIHPESDKLQSGADQLWSDCSTYDSGLDIGQIIRETLV